MNNDAVMVFTFKTVERLLADGGSSAWRLLASRAKKCSYLVCVRNAHDPRGTNSNEAHHAAFLVGRVSDVVPAEGRDGRYIILIDQYAEVSIEEMWQSGNRNPVRYATMDELGIDPDKLDWMPMPAPSSASSEAPLPDDIEDDNDEVRPLTMSEAKQGLALTFGVPPDSIEITIRG